LPIALFLYWFMNLSLLLCARASKQRIIPREGKSTFGGLGSHVIIQFVIY